MKVVAWLTEGTWEACVDATRDVVRDRRPDEVVLLHVEDPGTAEAWTAAPVGLFGRGVHDADPTPLHDAARQLLDAAAARLDAGGSVRRDARTVTGRGALEREVVAACDDADLLVCARDGDRRRLGPHSLGVASRFVVDHAPCAVLLVWPEGAPDGADRLPPLPADPQVDPPRPAGPVRAHPAVAPPATPSPAP
ncbi:universal stress protein [Luteimicrobium subarcticum]|uniref:Nucleotide-binding universal stress UspA family protein n=1 Tax=Luteimicrobium subarcticum TaxID=620910 RepID=A0A2M8W6T6_9MICO|nr:universal stress protein [Luteimicrobium subarcticum]PJI86641.1 nucleotide-binding universal stress UspA family protein [Luteimicrobium subarcticum]